MLPIFWFIINLQYDPRNLTYRVPVVQVYKNVIGRIKMKFLSQITCIIIISKLIDLFLNVLRIFGSIWTQKFPLNTWVCILVIWERGQVGPLYYLSLFPYHRSHVDGTLCRINSHFLACAMCGSVSDPRRATVLFRCADLPTPSLRLRPIVFPRQFREKRR